MQKLVLTGGALVMMGLASVAAAQDIAALDTDGDGAVSFPEMIVAYPDLTEDGFSVMDSSGDGLLDADEIAAAVDAGMITPTEG